MGHTGQGKRGKAKTTVAPGRGSPAGSTRARSRSRSRSPEPEPAWANLERSELRAGTAIGSLRTTHAFVNSMLGDGAWAPHVDRSIRNAIASAVATQLVPWLIEYEQFRDLVSTHCGAAQRYRRQWESRALQRDALLLENLNELRIQIAELSGEVRGLRQGSLLRARQADCTVDMGGTSRDDPSSRFYDDPDATIEHRVHVAQRCALHSRSPGAELRARSSRPEPAFAYPLIGPPVARPLPCLLPSYAPSIDIIAVAAAAGTVAGAQPAP